MFQDRVFPVKIPMCTRKILFKIYKQLGHAPSKRFASPVLGSNFHNHCSNNLRSHRYQSWYRFHKGYYVPCLINQHRNKLLPVGPTKFLCNFWNLSLSLSLRREYWETSSRLSWNGGVWRQYWKEQLAAATRQEIVIILACCGNIIREKRSLYRYIPMLEFFQPSSGTSTSPAVLLNIGDDNPDEKPTVQEQVPPL